MHKYFTGLILGLMISLSGVALAATINFPDVSTATWYAPGIAYVSENNIMTGYDSGNFGPNNNVNRAELATVLKRTMPTEILTELNAIRQQDTMNLIGSSWETYKKAYYRFPVTGIQFVDEGTIKYDDVKDNLEVLATDENYEILTGNGDYFFIKVNSDMCPDCDLVYGPFYDDANRLAIEIPVIP